MTNVTWTRGETINLNTVYSSDPTAITLTVYSPDGTLVNTYAKTDLTVGDDDYEYYMKYPIPADAAYGNWWYIYAGTLAGTTDTAKSYFQIGEDRVLAYCTYEGIVGYVDEEMYTSADLHQKTYHAGDVAHSWVNFQLGLSSDMSPVPDVIFMVGSLYAAYVVMSQKQEGQDYDKKSLADVRKKEAIELLRGYAYSTGTTLVMDDAAAAAAEMLSGDSATTSPEIAFGTMNDSAMY